MVDKLSRLPQLMDVASDLQDQGLQAYVTIDRDTAGRLGVTPAAIDNALYNAFGQRLISTIFTQATQYRVVLEVKPEFRLGPRSLNDIYVPASGPRTRPAGSDPGAQRRARRRPRRFRERGGPSTSSRARSRSATSASSRRPPSRSTSRPAPRSARR